MRGTHFGNDYTLNLAREMLARPSRESRVPPHYFSRPLYIPACYPISPALNAQKGAYAAAVAHGWSGDVLQLQGARTVDQCTSQRKAELSC